MHRSRFAKKTVDVGIDRNRALVADVGRQHLDVPTLLRKVEAQHPRAMHVRSHGWLVAASNDQHAFRRHYWGSARILARLDRQAMLPNPVQKIHERQNVGVPDSWLTGLEASREFLHRLAAQACVAKRGLVGEDRLDLLAKLIPQP